MVRGLRWLVGALVLAGLLVLALRGLCRSPEGFPALARYFCPRTAPAPLAR